METNFYTILLYYSTIIPYMPHQKYKIMKYSGRMVLPAFCTIKTDIISTVGRNSVKFISLTSCVQRDII